MTSIQQQQQLRMQGPILPCHAPSRLSTELAPTPSRQSTSSKKRTKSVVTIDVFPGVKNCQKCSDGWGAAPDPLGELTRLPRSHSWTNEKEGMGSEKERKEETV